MDEQIGRGMVARLILGDRNRAGRKPVALRELAEVRLMFLDKEVVTAPDCGQQSDRERACYHESNALFAPLCYLLGAETLGLGQSFASKARISAGLNNRNKDVMSKLDSAGVVPVFVSQQPTVY